MSIVYRLLHPRRVNAKEFDWQIDTTMQDLTEHDVEVPKVNGRWLKKKEEVIGGPSLPYKEAFSLLDRLDATISANRYNIRVSTSSKRALHHVVSFVLYAAWASFYEAEADERLPRRFQEALTCPSFWRRWHFYT